MSSLPNIVYYLDVLEVQERNERSIIIRGENSYTQVCGRKCLIESYLQGLVDDKELKQSHEDFITVKLNTRLATGERSCVRVGDILWTNGWKLINSQMTTCVPHNEYMKLFYKDRWSFEQ